MLDLVLEILARNMTAKANSFWARVKKDSLTLLEKRHQIYSAMKKCSKMMIKEATVEVQKKLNINLKMIIDENLNRTLMKK